MDKPLSLKTSEPSGQSGTELPEPVRARPRRTRKAIDPHAVGEVDAAVRELGKIREEEEFQAGLKVLEDKYPAHPAIFGARIRRLIKNKSFVEAVAAIDGHDFGEADDELNLLAKAELLFEAHETERADELFALLIEAHPDQHPNIRINYARLLMSNGRLVRAWEMLEPIRDFFGEGTKQVELIQKVNALLVLLERLEGGALDRDTDERITAMKHAILCFRDRSLRDRASSAFGRLTLITGGLGPGGAERQLTRVAIELERARKEVGAVAGIPLDRPVEVVVRSHEPGQQHDFYLNDIQAVGVELKQINNFEVVAPKDLGIDDPVLAQLIDYLPPNVNYGARRLTSHFRESGTDTASMWQDGACLFAGLAALIAGVPHIQLAIRGLPPSMRRHMYRPEYQVFYRAMAQVPGVYFISNNLSAARAYAEWLEISLDRFAIVYNGVEPMDTAASRDCKKRWRQFLEATPDATHTVGGVFRFDTDKQPLLWIRFAARYLKRHPDARIVLVGGGRLLDNAIRLAEDYGIQDRILFVGRSTHVGFWMTKMDVLVLLSRYEGLPNVLIEAQYMGVRVVTTPAGGAAECLIDGTTGHVLGCAESPDYMEIIESTHRLAMQAEDRELFAPGGVGRTFLDSHFSIPHMLAQYVTCTSNALGPINYPEEAPRSLRAA